MRDLSSQFLPPAAPGGRWRFTPWRAGCALLLAVVALGGFLYPAGVLIRGMVDPALNGRGMPALARRLHETLSPRYARWAVERRASEEAGQLSLGDVSGTEWPLYGSVFYLRAEEAIQAAWERDPALCKQEPRRFAREAIEAATRLVADPGQAAWVRKYWGETYLDKEDVFYRMMLISALASHRRLTGSEEFVPLLRRQTDGLAAELAAAPTGWLDDYPGQCYPTDIVSAWEAIQRADRVLGTDHSAQIVQGAKGFSGERLTALGLPPYYALAESGRVGVGARGCANSNLCALGPGLWPQVASGWYGAYEKSFWQRDFLAAGFREFPRGAGSPEWHFDVDAGPVVRGCGFAACAFGVEAARANGRFDHAYPLSLEMIALSWPLPGGRLLVPRIVSDAANAPLLGEAGIFLVLTQEPVGGSPADGERHHAGFVPGIVWVILLMQLGVAAVLLWRMFRILRPKRRG